MPLTAQSLAGQRRQVYEGRAKKTKGGLKKQDLTKSKRGTIVSKAKSARGKKLASKNGLHKWRRALKMACDEEDMDFHIPRNKSSKVYKKAKKLFEEMKGKKTKKTKRQSMCNKKKSRKSCLEGKRCSWIPRKLSRKKADGTRRVIRTGYCRRKSKK